MAWYDFLFKPRTTPTSSPTPSPTATTTKIPTIQSPDNGQSAPGESADYLWSNPLNINDNSITRAQSGAYDNTIKIGGGLPKGGGVTGGSTGGASSSALLGGVDQAQLLAQQQADAQRSFLEQQQQMLMAQRQKQRDATLGFIGNREQALGTEFNQNKQLAEQGLAANTKTAQEASGLSLRSVDEALAAALPVLNRNKNNIIDESERGSNRIQDMLARAFGARGAQDSSFYAKAVAESQGDLFKQRNDQLFAVDTAIGNATTQAEFQKSKINTELNALTSQLQQKKDAYLVQLEQAYNSGRMSLEEARQQAALDVDQFATESEIAKLGQLQQIQFNLDNYLQGLNDRRLQIQSSLSSSSKAGSEFDVNKSLGTFNDIYGKLSKTAGLESAGLAPRGTTGSFAFQAGLLDQENIDQNQYDNFLQQLLDLNDQSTVGF